MNRMRATGVLLTLLISSFTALFIEAQAVDNRGEKSAKADDDKNLRDVFIGTESASSVSSQMVGRLGIVLQTEDGFKPVSPDYAFRSGDHFRFAVTSNRDGWLYVMHAAPGGSLKQLWPRSASGSAIKSGQTCEIPPSPGVFIFDNGTGDEYFHIALRLDQTAPKLDLTPSKDRPAHQGKAVAARPAEKQSGTTTNFDIRDPFGGTGRDVVFQDASYLYFSAVPQDDKNNAMIEFKLKHVD